MFASPFNRVITAVISSFCFCCCDSPAHNAIGSFEKLEPGFDAIVSMDASIEIIADSLDWCEGPLWVPSQQMLLFSDIPLNTVYKWTPGSGKEIYLRPSGYTSSVARGGETGANGLALNNEGQLVLCQHGDRRIAVMDAPVSAPVAKYKTIADNYNGKKFDSPNDIVFDKKGNAYFTDPPYGLEKLTEDPLKEAQYQGVYRVTNGKVYLVTDSVSRPNGIALTPDQKTLVVANSDEQKPNWYAFDIGENDSITNGRIWYSAKDAPFKEKGGPDGFKFDKEGNMFSSAPGGIWIFDKNAKLLGRIRISETVSNCALSDNDKTLFVTADRYVLKIRLRE